MYILHAVCHRKHTKQRRIIAVDRLFLDHTATHHLLGSPQLFSTCVRPNPALYNSVDERHHQQKWANHRPPVVNRGKAIHGVYVSVCAMAKALKHIKSRLWRMWHCMCPCIQPARSWLC